MYASIRRYQMDPDSIDEVIRRFKEEGGLEAVSSVRGFVAYFLLNAGDGVGATVSIYEDEASAEESNKVVADWLRANLAEFNLSPPDITVGEVAVHKMT